LLPYRLAVGSMGYGWEFLQEIEYGECGVLS